MRTDGCRDACACPPCSMPAAEDETFALTCVEAQDSGEPWTKRLAQHTRTGGRCNGLCCGQSPRPRRILWRRGRQLSSIPWTAGMRERCQVSRPDASFDPSLANESQLRTAMRPHQLGCGVPDGAVLLVTATRAWAQRRAKAEIDHPAEDGT